MSPRPRIAHVLHGMTVAGAEILVHEMILALKESFEFSLVLLDEKGALGEDLESRGVPVHVLERRPGVDLGLVSRLRRALREDDVDLVHAHQYTPWFYGALGAAAGFGRPPILFTEHGRHYPDQRRPKRVLFNRFLTPITDGLVSVSGFVRDCLRDNEGLPPARIRVLYNGIDPSRFDVHPDRDRLRAEQGVGTEDSVVGIAARFAPVKDHATLLDAFAIVAREVPGAKLVLVGDGPLRGELESQVERLGLGESVRFLGVRRDVPELMSTWDVFTLTSLSEGTSVTLLEAMASGLPTVVTRVGGNPEIVAEDATGLMAGRGDSAGLAAALLRLLRDPELRVKFGAAGRRRVRESFTRDLMHSAYRSLYEELLGGGRT